MERSTRDIVVAGIVAGLIGAVLMGIVLMLGAGMLGRGFWTPMQQIGAFVLRDRWREMGALAALIGVLTHFAFASFLGAVFALATRRIDARSLLAICGVVYAGIVYLVMTFLVLPWVNPYFIERTNIGRFLVGYLVYGLSLGLAIPSAERKVPAAQHAWRRGPRPGPA